MNVKSYFMQVGVLCSSKKEDLAHHAMPLLEKICKLVKTNEKNRSSYLESIFPLFLSLFLHLNSTTDLNPFLEKFLSDLFPQSNKKLSIPHLDSVSVLVDIASLVSLYRPDFAFEHFILKAVSGSDQNLE